MKTHDQNAIFEKWLKDHKGILLKIACSFTTNPEDRKDLFQELATCVWSSIPQFRATASPTTWIYRVCLYRAIAWSKSEKTRHSKTQSIDEVAHEIGKTTKQIDPRLNWLYEQIATLGEINRSLVILILDGYSYQEVADILGISESNVGVKFNRIKKKLTSELRKD
ncbi:MAG: sigma-70 family RNA polymerase sigma factor [Verrucomicrobiota bacterium]